MFLELLLCWKKQNQVQILWSSVGIGLLIYKQQIMLHDEKGRGGLGLL